MLVPLNVADDAPWKARFRIPIVASTQIAHNARSRGLAVSNHTGIYQFHAWDVESGRLVRQLTDQPAGVVFGGISPDGHYIYYLHDQGGDEIGHFVRVPFEGGAPEDTTPSLPPYASFALSQSLSGGVLGFTAADREGFKIYTMTQGADGVLGEPTPLYRSARQTFGPILNYAGDYAVIATSERSQYRDFSLMAFDLRSAEAQQTVLVLAEDEGSLQPVAFAPLPGDTRLLATTNVTGFDRPVIWDVRTGDRTDIPLLGLDGNFSAWGWSPDGSRILLCQLVAAQYQLYVYDLANSALHKLDHPHGTFGYGYFYSDDEIFASWQDSTHPPQLIALDATTGTQTRVVLPAGDETPPSRPWKSVSFISSGGASIQAWLAVPEGAGPFPTILHTHGGPTSVQTETFYASAQAWLDHGFAFMSVNYRGSVTFGRQFEQAIFGQLGNLEVDDLAAAHAWLVAQRVAQPDAVLLTGGSYGGYLTLQTIGRRPELWAGGMAVVAIADWRLMYEDQAETLRGYQRSLFGGTPDELPEAHAASSPITYAEQLRAPILVIQGRNDTRCPARQMQVYEARLRELGKAIEVHWFDAGHGSRAMQQNIEHQELMLRWAYRILG
jgi:dipeptidyl aminopeptidase/acylaminoacyl peptidase